MTREKILAFESKSDTRRLLDAVLSKQDRIVADAPSGDEAVRIRILLDERFDLVILDRNISGIGALAASQEPTSGSEVGIITLKNGKEEADGHKTVRPDDDSVTKPFSMRELLAHILATLSRPSQGPAFVSFDQIEMDFDNRQMSVGGRDVRLTPKELLLLRYLVANANEAIPHAKLLQVVWGPNYSREVEYLRVFINRIRKKIEPDPAKPRYILTEPWFGYRFRLPRKSSRVKRSNKLGIG
jgi:two-component system, OmpR family, KDP operon response regulator KdpE